MDGKKDRELMKYYDLQMKSQTSNNPKNYEKALASFSDVKKEICTNINLWVKEYYGDKALDLQSISTNKLKENLTCILLDINLYHNPVLVSNAFRILISNFMQKQVVLDLATDVQILQNEEEIAILNQCSSTLKEMNKIAENSEFWMGKEDNQSLKISRNFIDKLSWLIGLCIYNDNRVLDMGKGNKKGKKGSKPSNEEKEEKDEEFEILNLSEFKELWDEEDM